MNKHLKALLKRQKIPDQSGIKIKHQIQKSLSDLVLTWIQLF